MSDEKKLDQLRRIEEGKTSQYSCSEQNNELSFHVPQN